MSCISHHWPPYQFVRFESWFGVERSVNLSLPEPSAPHSELSTEQIQFHPEATQPSLPVLRVFDDNLGQFSLLIFMTKVFLFQRVS